MKKIGILGGIGPESSIEYYRLIIKGFRERVSGNEYPEILIHSINMREMLSYVFEEKWEVLVEFLKDRIAVLEKSGLDYVAMASNTPHVVFDQLASRVAVGMISIVEESCKRVQNSDLQKVGLLGTKSTMSKGFYQDVAKKRDIEIFIPAEKEQDRVHEIYMQELVFNHIIPESKAELMEIVNEMRLNEGIEGLILGGTELPLMLKQEDFEGIKVFNTTQIHVDAILDKMLA
ncbi:MAG: amino acid racemase [Bacteroidota bacterium]